MKLLIVTNLFPNAQEPNRATFNFQQFSALSRLCELKVVAPVPYFYKPPHRHPEPSREMLSAFPGPKPPKSQSDFGGRRGEGSPSISAGDSSLRPLDSARNDGDVHRQIPVHETISGIEVFHPRYLAIPKIFRFTHGPAYFMGIWHTLSSIQRSFQYDAILAAWAYPDAFGAALAARLLKKKFYVKVHGSDINLAHKYWGRTTMIRWALGKADRVIAVSRPLKEKLVAMGIPDEKIVIIPNGVDKARFYPRDKVECRRALGLEADRKFILCVGNLAKVKGVEYLVRAFKKLLSGHPEPRVSKPKALDAGEGSPAIPRFARNDSVKCASLDLVIVGDGPLRMALENLANDLGIKKRVLFKGRRPYNEVPLWLNAVDVLCLPSLNEGCPNVVLEALACGTKVVASNVGGVPDIIDSPDKDWLAKPGDPDDLAKGLHQALTALASAAKVQTVSWELNAGKLFEVLSAD